VAKVQETYRRAGGCGCGSGGCGSRSSRTCRWFWAGGKDALPRSLTDPNDLVSGQTVGGNFGINQTVWNELADQGEVSFLLSSREGRCLRKTEACSDIVDERQVLFLAIRYEPVPVRVTLEDIDQALSVVVAVKECRCRRRLAGGSRPPQKLCRCQHKPCPWQGHHPHHRSGVGGGTSTLASPRPGASVGGTWASVRTPTKSWQTCFPLPSGFVTIDQILYFTLDESDRPASSVGIPQSWRVAENTYIRNTS
jgi:hypothetical protein